MATSNQAREWLDRYLRKSKPSTIKSEQSEYHILVHVHMWRARENARETYLVRRTELLEICESSTQA